MPNESNFNIVLTHYTKQIHVIHDLCIKQLEVDSTSLPPSFIVLLIQLRRLLYDNWNGKTSISLETNWMNEQSASCMLHRFSI